MEDQQHQSSSLPTRPAAEKAAPSPNPSTSNDKAQNQDHHQALPTSHQPPAASSSLPPAVLADYDLSTPLSAHPNANQGLRSGLTSYGDAHFSLFLRKVFIKALGYGDDALSRPIVGITNTYSSFNPCHSNVPQLIDAIKRGVLSAGGLAIDFPTTSIHESFTSPTSMYLRNLLAMDTEALTLAQPLDILIPIGGCDKTVPAQLMGCLSANKPFLPLVTGPMMPGSVNGVRVGACTDCRSHWARFRAGEISIEEIAEVEGELAPTGGTCGVMGTASTMACLLGGLGLIELRSAATAAAVSAARLRVAENVGREAVRILKREDRGNRMRPQTLLTKESFGNAITVLQAVGGSTNAVVHLMAIAGRHPGLKKGEVDLRLVDEIGRRTPLLVDLKPSGDGYMTDFHNAGGMLALMHRLRPLLKLNARTYTGETMGEMLDRCIWKDFAYSRKVVRSLEDPVAKGESLVVLYGNLAPDGAVMKASASKDSQLLTHRGVACVFENTEDMARRIDSEELQVSRDSVLVLKGIGPVGNPGMPEAGLIPIPRKLGREGVVDMLRISDGRMSGTAGGTIVLHVSPEAADLSSVFGVVRSGDGIVCDVQRRVLEVEVSTEEIGVRIEERKRKVRQSGEGRGQVPWLDRQTRRGYRGLYERRVNQAHLGCDFDFLTSEGPQGGYEE